LVKRNRKLFLIGFPGSGKTTIGPLVARRLKVAFADIDTMIEKKAGCSISEIFAAKGEKYFRHLEQETVKEAIESTIGHGVIALGGGAFENPSIRDMVAHNGHVVYLSCDITEICRRLEQKTDRPLLQVNPKPGTTLRTARLRRIAKLFTARKLNYNRADWTISTTRRSPLEAANMIVARFLKESKA